MLHVFIYSRFELVTDPKSKIDASKFFEIVPNNGVLASSTDRSAQAAVVSVSDRRMIDIY
jgi:hypothetical protein